MFDLVTFNFVWSHEDLHSGMCLSCFDESTDDDTYSRNSEVLLYVELEWIVGRHVCLIDFVAIGDFGDESNELWESYASDAGDGEDRHDVVGLHLGCPLVDLLIRGMLVEHDGRPFHNGALDDGLEIVHGLVVHVLRRYVLLGHDDHERDLQEQTDTQMFSGHLGHSHVGAHDDHRIVRHHRLIYNMHDANTTRPNIVVFRYFSCPHRSRKVTTFRLLSTISRQYLFLFAIYRSGRTCFK